MCLFLTMEKTLFLQSEFFAVKKSVLRSFSFSPLDSQQFSPTPPDTERLKINVKRDNGEEKVKGVSLPSLCKCVR